MDKQLEMIEKLTGIRSSRKNYYVELNEMVQEMQKKNKQLEVMNQLSRIHVNMSWEKVNEFIASQLRKVISFDLLILTLGESSSLSFFITEWQTSQLAAKSIHRPWKEGQKLTIDQLDQILADEFPGCHQTSVLLQSHTDRDFGFLTMLSKQAFLEDDLTFFQGMAKYAGIAVENIVLYKDVCEKMKIEAQLVQSAKLAAIGEMAAGVAHELNSPLTAILGNTQLLLRDAVNERSKRMLEDVYQCGLRSKKIIQNLLTFSRQDEYRFEELGVNDLVEDVFSLIGYQLKVSGITVERKLHPSLPLIQGSRYQIEQVVINLLLNARDALHNRTNPYIRVGTCLNNLESRPYVSLSVYDNGRGIKEENLPKIFNPFFTTKENLKGTGLGLSVSLGIAESHKGKMFVDSKEGEYSQFILLLPIPPEGE